VRAALLAGLWLLASCSTVDLEQRRAASARIAPDAGWQRMDLETRDFVLAAWTPPGQRPAELLTVYIEGDGLAYLSSDSPSFDPTPLDPVALRLALRDSGSIVAYLARPCQYVAGAARRGCETKYWTSHRFAPQVVRATGEALDLLKARAGAQRLALVGYSGGGDVAALAAAERDDVVRLTTVAAPLDHAAWTSAERLAPLSGSLNPADAWRQLARIPQKHYVGGKDRAVGVAPARAYAERFPEDRRPPVVVLEEYDHHCCWVERWTELK
jgi:pimeloyl-ACP methyl ester carboxylesterase